MHQDIPNGISVSIKDRLRALRYALRRTRENHPDSSPFTAEQPTVLPEIVLNRAAHVAARVMDKAFSTAESISISLVSDNPAIHDSAPDVQSLSFYFNNTQEGQRAFHRDMYYLTKDVLRRNKAENVLIHEAVFMSIYTSMKQQYGADIARLKDPATDTIQQTAKLCTVLFREMLRQQPVRQSNTLPKNALISGFAAISLACALATAKPIDMANLTDSEWVDNLESAMLAVEARTERISAALDQDDDGALQKLFATLIFHLP